MTLEGFVPVFDALCAASLPFIPILAAFAVKHIKDVNLRSAVETAIENGANLALHHGQQQGDALLTDTNVKSAAMTRALTYVQDQVPAALAYWNIDGSTVMEKLEGRVATKLLGSAEVPPPAQSDNTASSKAPAPAPAPRPAPPVPMPNPAPMAVQPKPAA